MPQLSNDRLRWSGTEASEQDINISSGLPSDYYDGRHTGKLRPIDRLLKGRDIKGQRFYLVMWGIGGIPTE